MGAPNLIRHVSEPPKSKWVRCPECDAYAVALIPQNSTVVENQDESDGKVGVDCPECGHEFRVLYQLET